MYILIISSSRLSKYRYINSYACRAKFLKNKMDANSACCREQKVWYYQPFQSWGAIFILEGQHTAVHCVVMIRLITRSKVRIKVVGLALLLLCQKIFISIRANQLMVSGRHLGRAVCTCLLATIRKCVELESIFKERDWMTMKSNHQNHNRDLIRLYIHIAV